LHPLRTDGLRFVFLGLLLSIAATRVVHAQSRAGVSGTAQGVVVTLPELRQLPWPASFFNPREASPRRTFGNPIPQAPAMANPAYASSANLSPPIGNGPDLAQTPTDEIFGLQVTDTAGFVPPDTMGAVGPTQFLFSVNDHLRAYGKNTPHTQIFDFDEVAFWGSTANAAGVSDTHVRYDRNTQRWFITEIDVPTGNNHILLAVSSGPDLSTATWTKFAIPATGGGSAQDAGCFADYDTPGIDNNAIYIGANMFGGVAPCTGNYLHSNLYVIQKSSALTNTLQYTTFYNLVTGTQGIATIQGVDSVDSLATGYAIAVNENESPRLHLNVWQINNPGSASPTVSAPTAVPIFAENGAKGGVLTRNNAVSADPTRPMDDIDDRLFSATIRDGHLWTAQNVIVSSIGDSNGSVRDREAVRWYDVDVSAMSLNQAGTVFDGTSSGFLEYWMGTVMVSGQGHVAIGLNRANSATNVQAGVVGRLAGDTPGTMQGFSLFQNSTADAYDDASFVTNPANRWGDYSYTSLDPCDDMSLWTVQEYVAGPAGGVGWGTAAEKLLAPGPAAPASANPSVLPLGQSSVNVVIAGTSTAGSGFYDTPATITDPCRQRIHATISGGAMVNSVTYVNPTQLVLNLSTVGASAGSQSVTITNPDGQSALGSSLITLSSDLIFRDGFDGLQ